jgi:AraC family transcriptional regulator, transcriptional activator of pobA
LFGRVTGPAHPSIATLLLTFAVMETEIKTYHQFNEYYVDANVLVRSKYDDFHVFWFDEIGDSIVAGMGPFRKTYYHFVIASALPAKVNIFYNENRTENYSLVVYLPGQIIQWAKAGEWDGGYQINVKESFLNLESISHLTNSYGFLHQMKPLVIHLTASEYEVLSGLFELMLNEQEEMKDENILVIRNLVQVMIVYINRIVSQVKSPGPFIELQYQKVANRFKSLVYEHYLRNRMVIYYASLLGVTPTYLA